MQRAARRRRTQVSLTLTPVSATDDRFRAAVARYAKSEEGNKARMHEMIQTGF
jgi:hypothetical protein